LIALLGKITVLLKRLFVDMSKLFQSFIDCA